MDDSSDTTSSDNGEGFDTSENGYGTYGQGFDASGESFGNYIGGYDPAGDFGVDGGMSADPASVNNQMGWESQTGRELSPGMYGGLNSNGDLAKSPETPASVPAENKPKTKTAAELLRAQFEDWQKIYKPVELSAIGNLSFNNPEILPRALAEARSGAEGYSNSMAGILSRQTRALGQMPTTAQKITSDRLLNLNRAATIASSENIARENVRTQDDQNLLGTAPNPNVQKAP